MNAARARIEEAAARIKARETSAFRQLTTADQLLVLDALEMIDDSCPDYVAWAERGTPEQVSEWLEEARAELG